MVIIANNIKKRSGKFYNKNEGNVMRLLGLTATRMSGAGWLEKEDGFNENVICQLKSTDKNSIRINLLDVEKLEYQAAVTSKLPVFAVQFLKHMDNIDMGTYLLIKPSDLMQVVDFLNDPTNPVENTIPIYLGNTEGMKTTTSIVSSDDARQQWNEEQEQKWKGRK